MATTPAGFIEIIVPLNDHPELVDRSTLEDQVDDVLTLTGLAEVSGGGSGLGVAVIDIDVFDADDVPEVVALLRTVLRQHALPGSTVIRQRQPVERTFLLNSPLV